MCGTHTRTPFRIEKMYHLWYNIACYIVPFTGAKNKILLLAYTYKRITKLMAKLISKRMAKLIDKRIAKLYETVFMQRRHTVRIMGIDPGTAICGYGIIDVAGSRLKPVHYGSVITSSKLSDAERLEILYHELSSIISTWKPEKIGVEELFFNRNVTTAITVGQARGVILLAAQLQKLPIYEYTPLQIKQAVVGYGKATKEQVIYMTMNILGIREKIKPDDTADALAAAICTAHSSQADDLKRRIQL